MGAPETWLPIADAARVAGVTAKALRRRVERDTVRSELRADGRRWVHVESISIPAAAPAPAPRGTPVEPAAGQLEELLARVETLAAENGRLRALTAVAESTEQALTAQVHEQRARVAELEAREAELADAGVWRAWRLVRRRRREVV